MCDLSKLRTKVLHGFVLISFLLVSKTSMAVEVIKDMNVSIFGGYTAIEASESVDFTNFSEIGMKIDYQPFNHVSFSGQTTYNTISEEPDVQYAFVEGYWGKWNSQYVVRAGILDNSVGIMSAGVSNPSSRSTVIMPRAVYILSQSGIGSSGKGLSFVSEYQITEYFRLSAEVRLVKDVKTTDSSKVILLASLVEYPFDASMRDHVDLETSTGLRLQLESDNLLFHYEYIQYGYEVNLEENFNFNRTMDFQVGGIQYTGGRGSIIAEVMHGDIDVIRASEIAESEHTLFAFPDVYEGPMIGFHVLGSWDYTEILSIYAGASVFHYDWQDKEGEAYSDIVRGYPSQVRYNKEVYAGIQYELNDWMTLRLEHHIMDGYTANFMHDNGQPSVVDGTWQMTAFSITFGIF